MILLRGLINIFPLKKGEALEFILLLVRAEPNELESLCNCSVGMGLYTSLHIFFTHYFIDSLIKQISFKYPPSHQTLLLQLRNSQSNRRGKKEAHHLLYCKVVLQKINNMLSVIPREPY